MPHSITYQNKTEFASTLTELFDLAEKLQKEHVPFKIEYDTSPPGKISKAFTKVKGCTKHLLKYRVVIYNKEDIIS